MNIKNKIKEAVVKYVEKFRIIFEQKIKAFYECSSIIEEEEEIKKNKPINKFQSNHAEEKLSHRNFIPNKLIIQHSPKIHENTSPRSNILNNKFNSKKMILSSTKKLIQQNNNEEIKFYHKSPSKEIKSCIKNIQYRENPPKEAISNLIQRNCCQNTCNIKVKKLYEGISNNFSPKIFSLKKAQVF